MMQNREAFPNSENIQETSSSNPWADMAETAPPFNPDQNAYAHHYETQQVDIKERQRAEVEKSLRKTINVGALMSDSDERLARQARLIDNSTFSIPGQEESADKRLEQAMKGYKQAKEFRDMERMVLEDILGGGRGRYSQEDLMEHLREYQDSTRILRDENWVQQIQACSRLMGRLEKFVPELADDLSREDLDYWNKITGSAKPVAPEALVPKTLPKDELAKL